MKAMKTIVGCYMHILNEDGRFHKQGYIKGKEGDCYIVQLFSWFDGGETCLELVPQADMMNPNKVSIYATQEHFDIAAAKQGWSALR